MLRFYKTDPETKDIVKLEKAETDCWIDLVSPTDEEIAEVLEITKIDSDLLTKMRDDDELPRVETSKDATLIVIDVPAVDDDAEYITYPVGIIVTNNNFVITISPRKTPILRNFRKNLVRDFRTAKKTRFIIQIMNASAAEYLRVLDNIYHKIEIREETLQKATKNEDIVDLLMTEKTLVYFTTSLKENNLVLERINKGVVVPLYEGDLDMLEDAIIENNQAIDMAGIYREIIQSMTETYATIVSNNQNNIMKFLAGVTIVLSIPTMISSFLGMNVHFGIIGTDPAAAWIILIASFAISVITAIILKKKDLL
ncbi:magnesium transporter CorA family protein [Candidatus Saccharibacteria bacterium]|nr:magnesium transporter CorA family protein [Candidatus Saccharibacteria bacterium]